MNLELESPDANQERPAPDTITSHWSIVPIFLKPDALNGAQTTAVGKVAADFAAYLSAALDSLGLPDYTPFFEVSAIGAKRARAHAFGEMQAIAWYTMPLQNVAECQGRLAELHVEWAKTEAVEVPRLISQACEALGFEIVLSRDRVLTLDDYMAFYGHVNDPELHRKLQPYMEGKLVRLLLLCGQQENSALQIMKTYLRHVVRYPTTKVTMENWIHVTNPDACNYPQLLSMYATG